MNLMDPLTFLRALVKGSHADPLGLEPMEGHYAPVDPAVPPPPVPMEGHYAPVDPLQPTPYQGGYRQPVG